MANSFWNFVTQFVPNNLAKAEDVNTNFSGVETGFDAVEVQTVQAIKITNTPGTVNISDTPANRADKIVSFDGSGNVLASIYIGNYRQNHVGVAGTVYNVRDTVKDAAGALGLNNIYICNTTHTSTGTLAVDVANWTILLDAAAAAASAAAALVSENNAAVSADFLDDRILGAFSTANEPALDNDGNALLTGAQYFNTDLNRMKVWNGAAWQLTTAAAVDVSIADAGTIYTATEVEAALQEVKVIADTAASTNTTQGSSISTNSTNIGINVTNIAANVTRLNAMDTLNGTQDNRLTATEIIANTASSAPLTTGVANSYIGTLGITALVIGKIYHVMIHADNTSSSTLNLDGTGVKNIRHDNAAITYSGELAVNKVLSVRYDGTSYIIINAIYADHIPEYAKYQDTVGATIGAGGLFIDYSTIFTGSNDNWDVANGRYGNGSIRVGLYLVQIQGAVSSAVASDQINVRINRNTIVETLISLLPTATSVSFNVTAIVSIISATNYITAKITNNTRNTSVLDAGGTMAVKYLGPIGPL